MSDEASDQEETLGNEHGELTDLQEAEAQDELDRAAAERRAAETAALSHAENEAYARNHKVIERDEDGNPIDTEE